jgi:hypothetical protein
MADARRFPRLELPFALVGAAGGFLSVELLSTRSLGAVPRELQPVAVIVGAMIATLVGTIVRKLCIGRKYAYVLDEPDAMSRATSDRNGVHAIVVLVGGALIGAIVGAALNCNRCIAMGALGGIVCSIAFLPVVIAVVRSARASQRARLGTLVARVDRRAVWSILATTLALTTLEAVPDWLSESDGYVAVSIACACGAVVLAVLLWDGRANGSARATLADLAAPPAFADEAAQTIDLGLGENVGARVARGVSAYRDRDRTLALVRGDPFEVRQAITRALVRGRASFAVISAVLGVHALAALVGRC